VKGSCEHGNEFSGSIKCWEILKERHIWRLLKKGSAQIICGMHFENGDARIECRWNSSVDCLSNTAVITFGVSTHGQLRFAAKRERLMAFIVFYIWFIYVESSHRINNVQ
jgi:hypothetical protein